jgi:hypothetical protein
LKLSWQAGEGNYTLYELKTIPNELADIWQRVHPGGVKTKIPLLKQGNF